MDCNEQTIVEQLVVYPGVRLKVVFQLLGVPIGVAVISFVGLLTWYTINGLVSGAEVGDGGRRNG